MKTSSKILLFAILVLIAGIAWYDNQLKQLFNTGSYLVPYLHYTDLRLAGFHHIRNESSSDVNMKILSGPFKVLLEPSAMPYTKVKVVNDTLVVTAEYTGGYRGNSGNFLLYVFCPTLSSLQCNTTSLVDGQPKTDTTANEYFSWRQTLLEDFRLDTLSIVQDHGSDIRLVKCIVNALHADVGVSPGSGSQLVFGDSNQIDRAHLNIRNKSRLLIQDALHGQQLDYTLDNNARMILYGRADRHLKKTIVNTQP
jgi:hypothetical protein